MTNKAYVMTVIATMATVSAHLIHLSTPGPITAAESFMAHLVHHAEEYENLWNTLDSRFVHAREVPQDNGGINLVSLNFEHTDDEEDLWTFYLTHDNLSGHTTIDLIQDGVIQ